jgi:hypothetical protein
VQRRVEGEHHAEHDEAAHHGDGDGDVERHGHGHRGSDRGQHQRPPLCRPHLVERSVTRQHAWSK